MTKKPQKNVLNMAPSCPLLGTQQCQAEGRKAAKKKQIVCFPAFFKERDGTENSEPTVRFDCNIRCNLLNKEERGGRYLK